MKDPEAFKTRILRAQQGRALSTNALRLEVVRKSLDVCDSLLESFKTQTTPLSEKLQAKINRLNDARANLKTRLNGPPDKSITAPLEPVPAEEPDVTLEKPIEPTAPLRQPPQLPEPGSESVSVPTLPSLTPEPTSDYTFLGDMFDVLTPESSENRGGEEHVVKLNPNRGHMFVKPPRRRLHKKPAKKWDPDPTPEVPPPPPTSDDESQYIEEDGNDWEDVDDQDYGMENMMSELTGAEKKAQSFLYNPVVGVVSKSRGVTVVDFNDVGVGPTKHTQSKT